MKTATQTAPNTRRAPSHPLYLNDGLSPKKTAFIIVTVIGCIAILWPKVFYPMMFGGTAPKTNVKDQRAPGDYHTGLRQERPAHLHPESIYQAMRERGRAIPSTPTVPIVERKASPSNPPPRIVEGRPGPIPGMRPPMGAGSVHQPQTKSSSMGFVMPLYTIGIIVFFVYTIMKIVFKKPLPNAPYGPAPTDANFRKEVFGQENGRHVEEVNGSKLGSNLLQPEQRTSGSELYNASLSAASAATNLSSSLKQHHQQHPPQQQIIALQPAQNKLVATGKLFNKETEQLMEIEKLRKKLEDTEKAMAKLIAEMNSDQYEAKEPNENTNSTNGNISNGHTTEHVENKSEQKVTTDETQNAEKILQKKTEHKDLLQRKRREGSTERSVAVLGMEVTASCEGGQKWSKRPPTPIFFSYNEHSHDDAETMPEPQSIYLEGSLAHESQILVADSETRTEEVYDAELNGSAEEPAVILSSKMTLSLINLDSNQGNDNDKNINELESPLADDIEIIGHDDEKIVE